LSLFFHFWIFFFLMSTRASLDFILLRVVFVIVMFYHLWVLLENLLGSAARLVDIAKPPVSRPLRAVVPLAISVWLAQLCRLKTHGTFANLFSLSWFFVLIDFANVFACDLFSIFVFQCLCTVWSNTVYLFCTCFEWFITWPSYSSSSLFWFSLLFDFVTARWEATAQLAHRLLFRVRRVNSVVHRFFRPHQVITCLLIFPSSFIVALSLSHTQHSLIISYLWPW
jgi:hypothetical protein